MGGFWLSALDMAKVHRAAVRHWNKLRPAVSAAALQGGNLMPIPESLVEMMDVMEKQMVENNLLKLGRPLTFQGHA